MSSHNIIDSNVIAIANGLHNTASLECMNDTIIFLKQIEERVMVNNDIFLIYDSSYVILNEYYNHCGKGKEKKLGTAFYKWVHRNINNPNKFVLHNLPDDIDDNNGIFISYDDSEYSLDDLTRAELFSTKRIAVIYEELIKFVSKLK
jgi:hypothetical protein